jgi:hypothetical protein
MTTFCKRPIAPSSKIVLARCHDGNSGKLKSSACEVGGKGFLEEDRFSELEGALRDGGLEIGRHRDGDHPNGALLDQCLPTAKPARDIRGPSKFRGSRRVGSGQRHDLAAGIVAECRDENCPPVIASNDANTNHDAISCANGEPISQAIEAPQFPCRRPLFRRSQIVYRQPASWTPYSTLYVCGAVP